MLFLPLALLIGGAISAQSASTAQISGDVINSVTGAPISDALVVVTYPGTAADATPSTKRIVTGPTGHFSFPAGSNRFQSIQISRNGYRSEDGYGAAWIYPTSDASTFTVKMAPLSAITGRVTNNDGEPIPGLHVEALAISVANGRRTYKHYASANTDDRGEYRLWHFTAGHYYLVLLGQVGYMTSFGSVIISGLGEAYGPVFYPSSPNRAGAQEIDLHPAEEFRADFIADTHVAYRIRGTIQNFPSYQPAVIRLLRDGDAVGNRTVLNPASGSFEVFDVGPGTYQLLVSSVQTKPSFVGEATVTVVNKDVAGVTVVGTTGVSVSGQLQFAGSSQGIRRRWAMIAAKPMDANHWPQANTVRTQAAADGKFTLEGLLPGIYDVTVQASGEYAASISSGTADVLESGLIVSEAGTADLKIEMTSGGGQVAVKVEGSGDPSEQQSVVAVRTYKNRILAFAGSASGGLPCYLGDLPPGDYVVYAWKGSREIEYRDPTVLAKLVAYGKAVSVQSAGQHEITVTPIPAGEIP